MSAYTIIITTDSDAFSRFVIFGITLPVLEVQSTDHYCTEEKRPRWDSHNALFESAGFIRVVVINAFHALPWNVPAMSIAIFRATVIANEERAPARHKWLELSELSFLLCHGR